MQTVDIARGIYQFFRQVPPLAYFLLFHPDLALVAASFRTCQHLAFLTKLVLKRQGLNIADFT